MTSYVKSFAGFTNPDHEIHVRKIDDVGGTEIDTVDATDTKAKNEKKRVRLSQPDWGKDSYMYLFDRHIARRAYTVPNVEGTFEGLCDKYVSLSVSHSVYVSIFAFNTYHSVQYTKNRLLEILKSKSLCYFSGRYVFVLTWSVSYMSFSIILPTALYRRHATRVMRNIQIKQRSIERRLPPPALTTDQ